MISPLNKPYLICWLSALILIGVGFVFRQHSVDIQLYATYVVIDNLYFTLVASLLLFLTGMGYWFASQLGQSPNRLLTAIHLLLTMSILLLLAIPSSVIRIEESTLLVLVASVLFLAQTGYLAAKSIRLFRA
jgi:heme/copper-type cytochrome/quinol oxidase subunit 1